MTADDLVPASSIDTWMRALVALLSVGVPGAASSATQAEVMLHSVQKLVQVLGGDPGAVRAWLKRDERGRVGGVVKLQAHRSPSEPRIPWPALLADERGEDLGLP